jgi:predicted Zn-dependent protease
MNFTYYDIDKYLNGEMNADELQQFEQQLQTDEQLLQQLAEYKMMQITISKYRQAETTTPELKAILQPLTKQYFQQKQQSAKVFGMKRSLYMLAAAASVALILFLAIPGVSADNYPVDDMSGAIVRGNEDEMAKAAQLFNNKKYAEAANAFLQLKAKNPNDATINYHLGISLVKQQRDGEALPLFEELAKGESVYQDDANFFAALSAYHLQQNDKAKQYAQAVRKESKFYKYARAVLKKIK